MVIKGKKKWYIYLIPRWLKKRWCILHRFHHSPNNFVDECEGNMPSPWLMVVLNRCHHPSGCWRSNTFFIVFENFLQKWIESMQSPRGFTTLFKNIQLNFHSSTPNNFLGFRIIGSKVGLNIYIYKLLIYYFNSRMSKFRRFILRI